MRIRFWVGLVAVALVGAGSVLAALLIRADDSADFHHMQREEAIRAARQTEAVAGLSVGQLASASSFFEADKQLSEHEFDVVGRSLLRESELTAAAFIPIVPASKRRHYERRYHRPITELGPDGGLKRAGRRAVYYPLTYVAIDGNPERALGFDLGSDPNRGPYIANARDSGEAAATPVAPLVLGGKGIVIYHAVYRDGAPTATVAERRRALVGYAAGSFKLADLAATANQAVPGEADLQLRSGGRKISGDEAEFDDAARSQVQIADRTWVLVVEDPNRPDISLPILLAVLGISLSALLASLILVWSRNERMQELERQASQDALTGLDNRRRFEEGLRTAMARSRRDGSTGALVMLDLDDFKRVNDSHGHPAGDHLIKEIADLLRRRTRESDELARLGGDEFAVILPRCGRDEALVVAEAIAGAIRTNRPEGDVEPITASIGVAMFGNDPRTSFATVVSEADTAMYAAKDGGRDGVRIFDPLAIREDTPGI